jgi:hypothetical protein
VVVVIVTGGGWTTMVSDATALWLPLVARTENVKLPAAVGVPVMVPHRRE